MRNFRLITVLLLLSTRVFANNLNDTVNVVIDLKQVDSSGLCISVYPPSDLEGSTLYQFPKSVPGIYEYLKSFRSLIKLKQNDVEIDCADNTFLINCRPDQNTLTYSVKSIGDKFKPIYAEDTYFSKDSIYILNWHYLLGFFQNSTERPYKIKIIKNAKLFGAGSLFKSTVNDTTDIYIAHNYKDLIHNPVLYSVPDTTSFHIGETNFTISCAGSDTSLNSKKINEFDFRNPQCDKFLWFYEGVTEYLAIKTLVNSGFFEKGDFFNELNESVEYHKNINFSKISSNVYEKKGELP